MELTDKNNCFYQVAVMVGSSSKLSKKFITGLENIGLNFEEVQKYFIYAGGDKNLCHKRYYFLKFGDNLIPIHKDYCICGVRIVENCYIQDSRKPCSLNNIYIIGNCCIKKFLPEGRSGRTCKICIQPHKNRKNNLCNVCRKIYKNEEDIDKVCITFGKYKNMLIKDLPRSYAIWCYNLDDNFTGNILKNLLKYHFKFVD